MQDQYTGCTIPGVLLVVLVFVLLVYGCEPSHASETGVASVYGYESGRTRADGKPFVPSNIGCAHKTRRLGSVVRVIDLRSGRSIMCPINDRGPYVRGRIIDLSVGAARALGVKGLAKVRID
jgi:rare lipoprotein A